MGEVIAHVSATAHATPSKTTRPDGTRAVAVRGTHPDGVLRLRSHVVDQVAVVLAAELDLDLLKLLRRARAEDLNQDLLVATDALHCLHASTQTTFGFLCGISATRRPSLPICFVGPLLSSTSHGYAGAYT